MPLLEASRAVPIVFVAALDPVGAGYVASLARPGGNATGFITYEYGIAAKWLELLKQIAPAVKRVAVMRNASLAGGAQFGAIQAVAPSLGTQLVPIDPSNAAEIKGSDARVRAHYPELESKNLRASLTPWAERRQAQDDLQRIQESYGLSAEEAQERLDGPQGEIIIECGVDGGEWTLVGTKDAEGWRFRATRNETAIYDLMSDEDRLDFEPYAETGWVDSWEAALAIFEEHPWHRFCPVRVHPNFAGEIWLALQDRFDADARHKDAEWPLWHLKDWRRLCHGGGRVSAYSDFT